MISRTSKIILTTAAAAATLLLNPAAAQADSSETNFLQDLNQAGLSIYDTNRAVQLGYQICDAFNVANGEDIAEYLYTHTSISDVPDMTTAYVWVLAAGLNLCPWHYHPERAGGFTA